MKVTALSKFDAFCFRLNAMRANLGRQSAVGTSGVGEARSSCPRCCMRNEWLRGACMRKPAPDNKAEANPTRTSGLRLRLTRGGNERDRRSSKGGVAHGGLAKHGRQPLGARLRCVGAVALSTLKDLATGRAWRGSGGSTSATA